MSVDRAVVVRAALRLLDEEGVDGLSLRRIASGLGIKAPSLYWHFKDKRQLMDQLAEVILLEGGIGEDAPAHGNWRLWLADQAWRLRAAMLAHRDGARVVAGANLATALTFGKMVQANTIALHAAGLELPAALRTATAVVNFTIGFTLNEQSPPPRADIAYVAEQLPTMAAAVMASTGGSDASFEHGLGLLLEGASKLVENATTH